MDRYLQKRLPSIEEQFDVKLATGVVIVISPGDLRVPDIKGWPPWPVENMMHVWLPPVTTDDFGLPESRWVCAQPTDSYYHRAVSGYHWKHLTKPSVILSAVAGGWPFLLLLPRQRTLYVKLSDVGRERALATAAIEFCDLPETEIKAKLHQVAEFYDLRERAVHDKHGIWD